MNHLLNTYDELENYIRVHVRPLYIYIYYVMDYYIKHTYLLIFQSSPNGIFTGSREREGEKEEEKQ